MAQFHSEVSEYRIYIEGLGPNLNLSDLQKVFKRYGTCDYKHMPSRGSALISYTRQCHAINAIASTHGTYLKGYQIQTQWARGWPRNKSKRRGYNQVLNEVSWDNRTVFCGGFYEDVTEDDLVNMFCVFGIIEEIELLSGRTEYAFIRFASKESAALAISTVDGTQINGIPVDCDWSRNVENRIYQRQQAINLPVPNNNLLSSSTVSTTCSEMSQTAIAALNRIESLNLRIREIDLRIPCSSSLVMSSSSALSTSSSSTLSSTRALSTSSSNALSSSSAFATSSSNAFASLGTFATSSSSAFATSSSTSCSSASTIHSGASTALSPIAQREANELHPSFFHEHFPLIRDLLFNVSEILEEHGLSTTTEFSNSGRSPRNFKNCDIVTIMKISESSSASKSLPKEEKPKITVIQEKDRNTELLCKICMDKELGILYVPCGHLISCTECAQRIEDCPLCRKTVSSKIKAYLS